MSTGVVDSVIGIIAGYRLPIADEAELQEGLAELLGPDWIREHDLAPFGRVDFFHPDAGVALEVKVQGAPAAVTRQLHGYAQHENVRELVLVTGRRRLGHLVGESLAGKPITVIDLWRGQL